MVKCLYIPIFIVIFQLISCEPGASKNFNITTANQNKVSLFNREAGEYLTQLGFKLVKLEEPVNYKRKLYKKYLLEIDERNVIQTVQIIYGDDLAPKVIVGEWVAANLSSSSENVFMMLKVIAGKHGLLLEEYIEKIKR